MPPEPRNPYYRIPPDKPENYKLFLEDLRPASEVEIHESLRALQAQFIRGIEESDELLKHMTNSQKLAQFRLNTSIKHT